MQKKIFPLLASTALLASCMAGRTYEPPLTELPEEWPYNFTESFEKDSPDCFHWWSALEDPWLTFLIEQAAHYNLDLSLASSRVLEARRMEKSGSALLYPHVDATAAYQHAQFSKKTINHILGTHLRKNHLDLFEAGFDAEWEIDLFGKNRHERKALEAQSASTEAEFTSVWISLSAEIAKNYIQLRGWQLKSQSIEKKKELQKEIVCLTQSLLEAGFVGPEQQWKAEEQFHLLSANKKNIEEEITKILHRLSVLIGFSPRELVDDLQEISTLPSLPIHKPIGIPSELLRRRPDIRKAERDLAATVEQKDAAIAALFPRISLTGFIGEIGIFGAGTTAWTVGPQLLCPIFNSKALKQDVDLSKIKVQQALCEYQKTILLALEETENALASFSYSQEKNQDFARSLKLNQMIFIQTEQLYNIGMKNTLDFLTQSISLAQAEENYQESQMTLLIDYVVLYKALAGGWEFIQEN